MNYDCWHRKAYSSSDYFVICRVFNSINNSPGCGASVAWVDFTRLPKRHYWKALELGFSPAVNICSNQIVSIADPVYF